MFPRYFSDIVYDIYIYIYTQTYIGLSKIFGQKPMGNMWIKKLWLRGLYMKQIKFSTAKWKDFSVMNKFIILIWVLVTSFMFK